MGGKEAHVPLLRADVAQPHGKESEYSEVWDQLQFCKVLSKSCGPSLTYITLIMGTFVLSAPRACCRDAMRKDV